MKKKTFISISVGGIVAVVVICAALFFALKLFRAEGQFVRVADAKGVTKGNSVIWRDTYVGKVTEVKNRDGQIDIWFRINPEFQKTIRSDAKACLTVMKGSANPIILLVGGQDQGFPFFDDGAQVPEIQEKELLGVQLSDKLTEIKNYGWGEIVVWIVIGVIGVFAFGTIRKNPKVLELLVKGKKAGHYGGRSCRCCPNEYIGQ